MKRLITAGCVCLCGSLLAVAVASAGNPTSASHAKNLAAKQCAAQKKADKAAFRATFGKHAMRNCIKGTTGETLSELKNAAKQCKSDRQNDPAAFQQQWGSNHNGRNALGKCISSNVKHQESQD